MRQEQEEEEAVLLVVLDGLGDDQNVRRRWYRVGGASLTLLALTTYTLGAFYGVGFAAMVSLALPLFWAIALLFGPAGELQAAFSAPTRATSETQIP